jgi:hypothetical protein
MPAHVQGRILSLSKRICGWFAKGAGPSRDSPDVVRVRVGHRHHNLTTGGIRSPTPFYHDDGTRADMQLNAVAADAQSLPKAKSAAQPTRSDGDIGVWEFWDYRTRRHRAIGGHKSSDFCVV